VNRSDDPRVVIVVGSIPERDEYLVREFYDRYRRPLIANALRAAGDQDRAKNVAGEEVAARTVRRGGIVRRASCAMAVLRGRVFRRRRPTARGGKHTEVPMEREDWPRVSDELDRALQGWQVAEAIRGLTREHRAVIGELFYRRHTVAEAALELGVPQATVTTRSFYALRALRDALEERGVTER
jgi:RNA polymerase sigma-70 factor (ECF subfamily)